MLLDRSWDIWSKGSIGDQNAVSMKCYTCTVAGECTKLESLCAYKDSGMVLLDASFGFADVLQLSDSCGYYVCVPFLALL
mmetsp:Transcript_11640/g.18550  ORF Transcript_11640/g.18550 Transcript_11640/m.18550 type:complete len:80 (+) Transcript_11640:364-603(+)